MSKQKNFRKVPGRIFGKLERIKDREVMVGCVLRLPAADLASGSLAHLGVTLGPEGVRYEPSVLPPASSGKYSAWNIDGRAHLDRCLALGVEAAS